MSEGRDLAADDRGRAALIEAQLGIVFEQFSFEQPLEVMDQVALVVMAGDLDLHGSAGQMHGRGKLAHQGDLVFERQRAE